MLTGDPPEPSWPGGNGDPVCPCTGRLQGAGGGGVPRPDAAERHGQGRPGHPQANGRGTAWGREGRLTDTWNPFARPEGKRDAGGADTRDTRGPGAGA